MPVHDKLLVSLRTAGKGTIVRGAKIAGVWVHKCTPFPEDSLFYIVGTVAIFVRMLKKIQSRCLRKKMAQPFFETPWCHGAPHNALFLPLSFLVSAAPLRTGIFTEYVRIPRENHAMFALIFALLHAPPPCGVHQLKYLKMAQTLVAT